MHADRRTDGVPYLSSRRASLTPLKYRNGGRSISRLRVPHGIASAKRWPYRIPLKRTQSDFESSDRDSPFIEERQDALDRFTCTSDPSIPQRAQHRWRNGRVRKGTSKRFRNDPVNPRPVVVRYSHDLHAPVP